MLPNKKELRVIDAFHGYGTIWKNIEKKYHGKIHITRIDIEQKDDVFMLIGDNTKFLATLPLSKYDVIDFDVYGVPYDQLKMIFERGYKGLVFVTFIQWKLGAIPYGMLEDIGYTSKMVRKCPTLFFKHGLDKFLAWLLKNGVNKVQLRKSVRRFYIGFEIK